MRRLAAALLLVAAPLAAGTPRVLAAPSSSAIESRRAAVENLHHQLQERRALLHFQVVRAADLHRQLAETSAGIVQVNARLGEVGRRIAATQRSLAWNRLQVAAAGRSLALHDAAMRRRLVDIYEHGALGELDVLLSARSFSDFVERWDDLRFVVAADQRTIRERRSAAAKVAAARAALTARENGLDDSERAQSQARAQLAALGAERAQLVAAADTQTHSVQTQV
ncbi:MAG: PcsB-like coiled-coil domain-containing protein, partial [Candidatus Dormibacteria bacterium]